MTKITDIYLFLLSFLGNKLDRFRTYRCMDNKTLIQKLTLEILASDNIDDKRVKRNQVVELFKGAKLVNHTQIAIRLNTSLELKETIDNYITHDNTTSREALKNMYSFVSQLLCKDCGLNGS